MTQYGEPELLPCPFCGNPARFLEPEPGGHCVECSSPMCQASSRLVFALGDDPKPILYDAWNKRDDRAATARYLGVDEAATGKVRELVEALAAVGVAQREYTACMVGPQYRPGAFISIEGKLFSAERRYSDAQETLGQLLAKVRT